MWVSKCGRNFDQTSTPQVSKLRPNFDTPSVEVWSKFARYINDIHCKFDKMSTKLRHQTSTKLRPPVSKFGLIDDDRNNQQIVYFS